MATEIDTTRFKAGLAGLVKKTRLDPKIIMRTELGKLIETLVRISPVAAPKKIEADILKQFGMVSDTGLSEQIDAKGSWVKQGKMVSMGKSGILWYAANENYLYGIAPENDKRNASVDELKRIRHSINRKGRVIQNFKHPRKGQKVSLRQTILTRPATVKRLIASVKKNRGRLKAGWTRPVAEGIVSVSAAAIPGFVLPHMKDAHGRFINGLDVPGSPEFTLSNFAKGVGNRASIGMVNTAVRIRAKAMATNLALMVSGKKNLSEYAKGAQ